jgi:hypothetical protein
VLGKVLGGIVAHLREIATVLSAGIVGLLGLMLGFAVLLAETSVFTSLFPGDDSPMSRARRADTANHAHAQRVDRWLEKTLAQRGAAGTPFTLSEILPGPATHACLETQRWPSPPPTNAARELARGPSGRPSGPPVLSIRCW